MSSIATRILRIDKRLTERERPKAVLTYSDPLFFARHSLNFAPDPWQERVLSWQEKRLLLNCCRQSGKSTLTSIRALHQALYFAHSLILLLSPTLRQSQELFRKVTDFLARLPVKPELVEDNKLSLQMKNGSRIVSLPSKEANIRGYSGASLIVIDEAARVLDDLYLAIRPMLAVSGGQLICLSTPFGRRGFFYNEWENGEGWDKVMITADQCPRISPEFLAEEKKTMPALWYEAEYLCRFTDTIDSAFSSDDIAAALSDDSVMPLFLNGEHYAN
jgi:hypothetical protein